MPFKPGPERDNSQKIEALLKRMTLEEKVGQMTQLAIGMIAKGQDQEHPDRSGEAGQGDRSLRCRINS